MEPEPLWSVRCNDRVHFWIGGEQPDGQPCLCGKVRYKSTPQKPGLKLVAKGEPPAAATGGDE